MNKCLTQLRYRLHTSFFKRTILLYLLLLFFTLVTARSLQLVRTFTAYDLILWNFSTKTNLVFVHTILFFILIAKAVSLTQYDIYIITKFKDRNSLYLSQIVAILFLSILYILCTTIAVVLQCMNVSFLKFHWNPFLIENFGVLYVKNPPVTNWILPFFINLFFYFISIGLIYFLLQLVTKKRTIALLFSVIFIMLNYMVCLCKIDAIIPYTPLGNVLLGYSIDQLNTSVNWIYFGIVLSVLLVLCHVLYKNTILLAEEAD